VHLIETEFIDTFNMLPIFAAKFVKYGMKTNEVMRTVMVTKDVAVPWPHEKTEIDPRYLCVSVEHTNYEPLSFDEVEARIKARWEATGYVGPEKAWGNGSGPN